MPSLTLFRTYLVQVYNIMRNVTTFLKVIFVHFSKDNETVSFIKLLDFCLSQGRVSAVSIKCDLLKIHYLCGNKDNFPRLFITTIRVVICSKFITFAVTKTTHKAVNHRHGSCDLLKIHYLCGNKDNHSIREDLSKIVVICSKFITFAVTKTTQEQNY